MFVFFTCDSHFRSHQEFSYIHTDDPHCLTLLSRRSGIASTTLTQHVNAYKGLRCSITDYISVGRMLYSICVRTLTLKFLTLSRSGERMRLLCTHLVLAHILLEGTLFSLNIGKIHISLTWKLNLSSVVTSRGVSALLS